MPSHPGLPLFLPPPESFRSAPHPPAAWVASGVRCHRVAGQRAADGPWGKGHGSGKRAPRRPGRTRSIRGIQPAGGGGGWYGGNSVDGDCRSPRRADRFAREWVACDELALRKETCPRKHLLRPRRPGRAFGIRQEERPESLGNQAGGQQKTRDAEPSLRAQGLPPVRTHLRHPREHAPRTDPRVSPDPLLTPGGSRPLGPTHPPPSPRQGIPPAFPEPRLCQQACPSSQSTPSGQASPCPSARGEGFPCAQAPHALSFPLPSSAPSLCGRVSSNALRHGEMPARRTPTVATSSRPERIGSRGRVTGHEGRARFFAPGIQFG